MADVKRAYHAPVRAQQARQTRRRILDAAAASFAAHGWSGTTVGSIARAAEVTPQAVHLSVGTKPALLIAAVAAAVAGEEDADRPLRERAPFRDAFDEAVPLPARAAAFAAGTRQVYERAGALFMVLAHAAPTDPELAGIWEKARSDRLSDCRLMIRRTGSRRDAQRRAQLLFVQSGPGVHAELGALGWSGTAYESWLAMTVEGLLR
jgi:AcrR family transcriptional regulator